MNRTKTIDVCFSFKFIRKKDDRRDFACLCQHVVEDIKNAMKCFSHIDITELILIMNRHNFVCTKDIISYRAKDFPRYEHITDIKTVIDYDWSTLDICVQWLV